MAEVMRLRIGREQVWCRLLTTIASHGGDHGASDVGKQLRAEIAPQSGSAPSAVVGVADLRSRIVATVKRTRCGREMPL
jgi:hypothetical protein